MFKSVEIAEKKTAIKLKKKSEEWFEFNNLSNYIRTVDRIVNNAIEPIVKDVEMIDNEINWLEGNHADSFQVWNTTISLDHKFEEHTNEWNILEEKENCWTEECERGDDLIDVSIIDKLWSELTAIDYNNFDEHLKPSLLINAQSIIPLTNPSNDEKFILLTASPNNLPSLLSPNAQTFTPQTPHPFIHTPNSPKTSFTNNHKYPTKSSILPIPVELFSPGYHTNIEPQHSNLDNNNDEEAHITSNSLNLNATNPSLKKYNTKRSVVVHHHTHALCMTDIRLLVSQNAHNLPVDTEEDTTNLFKEENMTIN